jgi:hypothetical protein
MWGKNNKVRGGNKAGAAAVGSSLISAHAPVSVLMAVEFPSACRAERDIVQHGGADAPATVREFHDWKLLSLACRSCLLVLDEDVGLVTGHTRFVFHEGI